MHIKEDKIELFVFAPELIDERERKVIQTHLNECHLCMEFHQTTKKTYDEINLDLEKPALTKDIEFADKIYFGAQKNKGKLLTGNNTNIQIYDGNFQIIPKRKTLSLQEIGYFIRRRPILSGGLAFMTIAVIASLFTLTYRSITKDDNPVYAQTKAGILEIYNTSGELLWKKTVGNLPDVKLDELSTENKLDIKRYFSILDIDNDKKNEVFISGSLNNRLYANDSLYCFDYKGELRWTTSAGKFLNFGTERWKHTEWNVSDYFTVKSGGKNQLIVIAHDNTFAPLVISKLNPQNGQVISSYYHCGWNLSKRAEKLDIYDDGNEQIILGLTNNALRRAALLILSPDKLEGMSPADQNFYPQQYYKGKELYYILFPISNFAQKFARAYSFTVYEMSIGNNEITVNTNEAPANLEVNGSLIYSFDKMFRVVNVMGSQSFNRTYDEEFKKGVFSEPRDQNYFKKIVDSVQYWDGDKFVNYYAMNKYYQKDITLQPLP